MRKTLTLLALTIILAYSACSKEEDPYLITGNSVGKLSSDLKINELENVYAEDSIVRNQLGAQYMSEGSDIEIYEKNGPLLMVIQPTQQYDSTSTIGSIQIVDPRFRTKKGLNIQSTFGDIVENYSISRIENTLSSAVVFIDDINAYITIDKKHLPSELRYNTNKRIEASQIPDGAKFKHFIIGWN